MENDKMDFFESYIEREEEKMDDNMIEKMREFVEI